MEDLISKLNDICYYHINKKSNRPEWRGVKILKYPNDLLLYAEVIYKNKPDFIIETGTKFGGSALFFADMLDLFNPGGKVITIDISNKEIDIFDERIEYILGSSADRIIVEAVKKEVGDKKVMVVLDSDHFSVHVKRELRLWGSIVTRGQYLVLEDCFVGAKEYYPNRALNWYLGKTDKFSLENLEKKFLFAITRGGWLRKK